MTLPAHRRGDERGTLASSSAAALAGLAVLAAAIYYVATGGPNPSADSSADSSATPTPSATPSASESATPTPSETPSATATQPTPSETAKPVNRARVQVAVFNASRVTGLAGRTGARLEKLGWAVHRVDNWSGSLTSSTVFYTAGNRQAALLLADDLGLSLVRPATSAMPSRGLTLILAGELP